MFCFCVRARENTSRCGQYLCFRVRASFFERKKKLTSSACAKKSTPHFFFIFIFKTFDTLLSFLNIAIRTSASFEDFPYPRGTYLEETSSKYKKKTYTSNIFLFFKNKIYFGGGEGGSIIPWALEEEVSSASFDHFPYPRGTHFEETSSKYKCHFFFSLRGEVIR